MTVETDIYYSCGLGDPSSSLLHQVPVKWLIPEPVWLSSHRSKDTDAVQIGDWYGGGRLDMQTDLAKVLLSSSHILLVASKSHLE